ncbi:MAG: hypothetical protein H6735_23100 [Alphaproteobacteria bacterium]|nr:hypothetical protein [Alphaproteobacteria bacterium]
MRTRLAPLLAVLVAIALQGCDGATQDDTTPGTTADTGSTDDTGGSVEPLVVGEVVAVVGAAGGTIDGGGELGFEGLRVEIPAGALSDDTTITVRRVSVAPPLPSLGEQCGQSFEIDGDGASLALPIEVTLPVDAAIVAEWGQAHGDVKVWVHDGADAWQSVVPDATADGEVRFAMDGFGAAAAGVKRSITPTMCAVGTCGTTSTTTTATCPGPAFCVTQLSAPAAGPETGTRMTTDGTSLFYLTRPGTNQVAVARVNGATGALATSTAFSTTSTARRNLVVPKFSSEAWVGIGIGGNLRFKFDGTAPVAFDVDADGRGGIAFDDGTFTRLSSLGTTTRQQQSQTFEARSTGNLGQGGLETMSHAASDADLGPRAALLTYEFSSPIDGFNPNPGAPTRFDLGSFPQGDRAVHRPAIGATRGGQVFAVYAQTSQSHVVTLDHGSGVVTQVQGMPHALDAVVDASGDVWLASTDTPELGLVRNIMDPGNRSLEMVPLTNAGPTTTEYQNTLPRGLALLSDGRVAVHTLDGRILVVRRPGT